MPRIARSILRFRHGVKCTLLAALAACGFRGAALVDADQADGSSGMGAEDSDADGIRDETDNCVTVATSDQHDDDGDGVGDACDPCPQIKETAEDSDGDKTPKRGV